MSIWLVRLALFAVPMLLLIEWVMHRRGRERAPGRRFFTWSRIALVALWLGGLLWILFGVEHQDGAPGSSYAPARIENGRIVPGEMLPPE